MRRIQSTRILLLLLIVPFFRGSLPAGTALAQSSAANGVRGTLGPNTVITSDILEYDLQYRVYTPAGIDSLTDVPVLYVADGQWYIEPGNLPGVIDRMITAGDIDPIIAVFVDNRNPHSLGQNRRNNQFFCNHRYIRFYRDELAPAIEGTLPASTDPDDRTILGLSFGGLNAACFGIYAHDDFGGIAMQSPAMHPVPWIWDAWADSTRLPVRIFLSSGDHNDNEARTRRLRDILQDKGYDMQYLEVPFAHNWQNWGPLLDDVLLFFYGTGNAGGPNTAH